VYKFAPRVGVYELLIVESGHAQLGHVAVRAVGDAEDVAALVFVAGSGMVSALAVHEGPEVGYVEEVCPNGRVERAGDGGEGGLAARG